MGRLTRRYRIWYRDWWAKRSSRQDWTTEQWCDSNFTATLQCRDPSMVLARNAVDIARCIPISTPDDGRPPHVVPQVMHEDRLYNLASRLIGLMGRAETKIAAVHLYKILKWTQVHIDEGRKEYVSGMEARMLPMLSFRRRILRRPYFIWRMARDYQSGMGIRRSIFIRRNWPRMNPWKALKRLAMHIGAFAIRALIAS